MKNIIVYFGMALVPDKNSVAQRANSITNMANRLGYNTYIIGFYSDDFDRDIRHIIDNGQEYYALHYPSTVFDRANEIIDSKKVIEVIKRIGINSIDTFIFADYLFFPMLNIILFCKRNNIQVVLDIMDWFQPSLDFSIVKNAIKTLDTILRLHILYPRIEKKICISKKFKSYYKGAVVTIPMVIDEKNKKWEKNYFQMHIENICSQTIKLCFAGFPAKHFKKERLDWVLKAVSLINKRYGNKFDLYIAGVSNLELKKNNRKLIRYVNDRIHFMGKCSHEECLNLIATSDFSMLIRKKSKYTEYSFSTKISESLACGTPIISTKVGEIVDYIEDGKNGFLCGDSFKEVYDLLIGLMNLSLDKRIKMFEYVLAHNRLTNSGFMNEFEKVIKK